MKVYHVTSMGERDSTVRSFFKEGAHATFSEGNGQGNGFYVWSSRARAELHSENLKNKNTGKSGSFIGDHALLTFSEEVSSKNWDFDYETSGTHIAKLFYLMRGEIEEAAKKGTKLYYTNDSFLTLADAKSQFEPDKVGFPVRFHHPDGTSTAMRISQPMAESDLLFAKKTALFSQALRRSYLEVFAKAMDTVLQEELPQEAALKYIGSKPILPQSIEVHKNGGWQSWQQESNKNLDRPAVTISKNFIPLVNQNPDIAVELGKA